MPTPRHEAEKAPTLEAPKFIGINELLQGIGKLNLHAAKQPDGSILRVEGTSELILPGDFPRRITELEEIGIGAFGISVAPRVKGYPLPGVPGIPAPIPPSEKHRLNEWIKALPPSRENQTHLYQTEPQLDQMPSPPGLRRYTVDFGSLDFDMTVALRSIREGEYFHQLLSVGNNPSSSLRKITLEGYVIVRMFPTPDMANEFAGRELQVTRSPIIFDRNAGRANPGVIPRGRTVQRSISE